ALLLLRDRSLSLCGRYGASHGRGGVSAPGCGSVGGARSRLPSEESSRGGATALRGGRQPLESRCTGGDYRVSHFGERRSQRGGLRRRDPLAPSRAHSVIVSRERAAEQRGEPEAAEQAWVDAAPPCG